jgi:peptidoglycan/xylan/chitin deacetylase (PgdA/CDA1 family)
MSVLRCFTLHAERLEHDDVWDRTSALLRSIEGRGGRATLFVHPFTAIEAGADLGPRIRGLLARGHEVGQHTHFYAPRAPGATGKPESMFTAENVRRCLDRDLAYLREAGATPRGFVAGGWAIDDEAGRWLREQGFAYDASVRSFALSYPNPEADRGGGRTAPRVEDGLLMLPTTATVTAVARTSAPPVVTRAGPYAMAYTHDYDLLRASRRALARIAVGLWRGGPWATAGELADRFREESADG